MNAVKTYFGAVFVPALFAIFTVTTFGQGTGGASAVSSVEISPSKVPVEVGQKVQFSAVLKDASGNVLTEKPTGWYAAPFDLAKADENGNVSFFQPGEVTVIALVAGKPTFTKVVVKPAAVKTILIDKVDRALIVGGTIKLRATALVSTGDPRSDAAINWVSENSAVASVDAAGVVTGLSAGKASLKASSGSAMGTITVNVVKASLRELSVEPRNASAKTGDVIHFKALTEGSSGSYEPRWAVSGEGATIEDGVFVAERPGSYLITATIGDRSASASVVIGARNVERELKVVSHSLLKETQGAEEWRHLRSHST